ncbi:MAG: MFS transporter [Phycisphaerae bacterium]
MASVNLEYESVELPTPPNSEEMVAYYANRPLMWRNMFLILVLNLGWQLAFTVINPLMQVRLKKLGMSATALGWMGLINSWTYSYLVMYFAWKSDHMVSRWGRRLPFLFISSPIIIVCTLVFPFFSVLSVLVAVTLIQMFFTDIKAATIPLLQYDCMPRKLFARCAVPFGIIGGLISFASFKYGTILADKSEVLPYIIGASVLVVTTAVGGLFIKEPPVRYPTTETFKPWSAMQVAWKDKRLIILMVSYSLVYSFGVMVWSWNWLYGIEVLKLSRTEVGSLMAWTGLLIIPMSYPLGWLIDRFSIYYLLPLLVVCAAAMLASLIWFPSYNGFIFFCCVSNCALMPMFGMMDFMICRMAPAEDMGSITSTNASLKGIFWGLMGPASGWLIDLSGKNYLAAFIFGFVLTCVGVALAYIYGWTMRRSKVQTSPSPALEFAANP